MVIQIEFFTPEQKSLIPLYKKKWRKVAFSTESIDRNNASIAIQNVYRVMGKRKPSIEFCSSPQNAIDKIISSISDTKKSTEIPIRKMSWHKWLLLAIKTGFERWKINSDRKKQPLNKLIAELNLSSINFLEQKIINFIPQDISTEEIVEALYLAIKATKRQTEEKVIGLPDRSILKPKAILNVLTDSYLPKEAMSQLYDEYWMQSDEQIKSTLFKQDTAWLLSAVSMFSNQSLTCTASWLDFCFSTLNLPHNHKKWEAFQTMVRECGWIFIYKNNCYICDRPIKLLRDENNLLHSETEPAIQFKDGFDIWVNYEATNKES